MFQFILNKVKLLFINSKFFFVLLAVLMMLLDVRFIVSIFFIRFIESEFSFIYTYCGLFYLLIWFIFYVYLIYKKEILYRYILYNFLLNFMIIILINKVDILMSLKNFLSVLNILDG